MEFLIYIISAALLFSQGQCDDDKVLDAKEYERLLDDLWKESSVARRHTPPFNATGSVNINYGIALISAMSVDKTTGEAQLLCWDQFSWKDDRLSWDRDDYDSIGELRVPSSMIWKPDLFTYNSLVPREEDARSNVYAVASYDGSILYIPPSIRKVRCKISDDSQKASCKIKVGSWTFNGNMVDLNFYGGKEKLDVDNFVPGGAASAVFNNRAVKTVKYYPCCSEPYPDLAFTFDLDLTADGSLAAAAKAKEDDQN